jgi:predicted MFS family arabinose efflux permease
MRQPDRIRAPSRAPWSVVWALSITQIVSWGSLFYAFSVLLAPIERDTRWARDTIVGAFSLGLLVAGLGALPAGMLVDRLGGRAVMSVGSALAGIGLLLLARTESVPLFYALWAGLGVAMALLLYEPAFAVIYASFGAHARKGITALTLTAGFASTVFWPLSQWLVHAWGWRDAVLILGLANLVLCMPLHVLMLPPRGATATRHSVASSADAPSGRHARVLHRLARNRAFWLLALSFTAHVLAFSALSVHLIPLLQERGLSAVDAVLLAAVIGPMQVLGRVLEFTGGARFRPAQVGLVALALLPVALVALALAGTGWLLLIAFVTLYGASNGVMTIVRAVMPAELFGREAYGTINGALSAPVIISRAAAPIAAAMLWSATGGYAAVLAVLIGLGLMATIGFAAAVIGR